jgi:hypothetical protein
MTEENLEDIAKSLLTCPDKEMLAVLRRCWSAYAMNAACQLLTQEKREQISQWITELNACTNR